MPKLLRRLVIREDDPSPASTAERRAASLPTYDIVPWAETCLYTVGRALSEHSRNPSASELVEEAVAAAETLQVLLAELRRRT